MTAARALLAALVLGVSASSALAAGNIEVEIDDKRTLRLFGDAADNSLEIVPGEGRDVWLVVGTNGTTIAGLPQLPVVGARGLRVVLDEGDDRVEVRGLLFERDLRIDVGNGRDRAVVRGVTVRGRVAWFGRGGDDTLTIENGCVLRRTVKLAGNRGADEIILRDSRVLGRTRMRGNKGHDRIIIRRSSFVENAKLLVKTGSGEDDVTFDSCKLDEDVRVETGGGDDFVLVVDCHANDDFDGRLGSQDDRLNLDSTTFNKDVDVDGQSGKDRLDFDGKVKFRGYEKDPNRYEVEFDDFERGG